MSRTPVLAALLLVLAGCWNGENVHVKLGDVSLGQQLMDLKTAQESGALTEEEYATLKAQLLALGALCENNEQEED